MECNGKNALSYNSIGLRLDTYFSRHGSLFYFIWPRCLNILLDTVLDISVEVFVQLLTCLVIIQNSGFHYDTHTHMFMNVGDMNKG